MVRASHPNLTQLIAYEQGELDHEETVDLFQEMIDSGVVWELQGSYGREANALLEAGEIYL
jgi:hypothetical protein